MDEYISREAVNNLIEDMQNNRLLLVCERTNLCILKSKVAELPVADVQSVKHGRWIEQRHTPTNGYNYNVPYSTYVCSSCGLEIHNDEYSKYVRGTYTNCPVCTARIDVSG